MQSTATQRQRDIYRAHVLNLSLRPGDVESVHAFERRSPVRLFVLQLRCQSANCVSKKFEI